MLVAYAAAAGTTAAEGTGRFRRVRARVLEATNGAQRPHEYQSLLREHYLSGAPAVEAVTVEAAAPDVADVDVTELAVAQLRVLAERGDADAQSELGRRYSAGCGVGEDAAEAVHWYRRSAEQGHPLGQVNLGAMYSAGRSVGQDFREAVRWYRRSAEQGHPLGQNNGNMPQRQAIADSRPSDRTMTVERADQA